MTTTTKESDRADHEQAHDGAPQDDDRQPKWLQDVVEAAAAVRALAAAQWRLFNAELALARSASQALLVAGLLAIVFAVGLSLTLLALAGWGLTQWLGSWTYGLAVLAGIQIFCLILAIWFARRCLHWLTLPESRAQLHALVRQTTSAVEHRPHATDSTNA